MQPAHHSLLTDWSLQFHNTRPNLASAVSWQMMHTVAQHPWREGANLTHRTASNAVHGVAPHLQSLHSSWAMQGRS